MKQLIILVGPPGSGKSTLANNLIHNDGDHGAATVYVNQDSQGKGHLEVFNRAVLAGQDIIVDRMNFNKEQRRRYLEPAKAVDYSTKIVVLHVNQATCLERMLKREGHPTIQDEKSARSALHTFFSKYERPQEGEVDEIEFRYPEGDKPSAVICDLDGTLCDIDHRLHFVRDGKKDWKNFFYNIPGDSVNNWCRTLLSGMFNHPYNESQIVYCSGRGNEYRNETKEWLVENGLWNFCGDYNDSTYHLYMREAKDSRPDTQIKENILDFELLTRFSILFAIDDRQTVVDMWRRRGIVTLQCAKGDF